MPPGPRLSSEGNRCPLVTAGHISPLGMSNKSPQGLSCRSGDQQSKGKLLPSKMPRNSSLLPVHVQERIHTPQESKPNKEKRNTISQGLDSVSLAGPSAMFQGTGNTY